MKITIKSILLVLITTLLISTFVLCSDNTKQNDSDDDGLTLKYFKDNLTQDTTYDEIVKLFGEPDKNIGSGINIYVYELKDLTQIWIGYVDKIYYVKHMDKDGNLIEDIISND